MKSSLKFRTCSMWLSFMVNIKLRRTFLETNINLVLTQYIFRPKALLRSLREFNYMLLLIGMPLTEELLAASASSHKQI